MSQLADIVWSARSSVCQVETLDYYGVAHEDDVYRAFLEGRQPSEQELAGYAFWFARVDDAVRRGVEVSRIHLMPDQPGDYLRYEVEFGYRQWCIPHGETVGLLKKSDFPELSRRAFRDFYVIDDVRILTPEYTDQNRYVGLSEVINPQGKAYFISLRNDLRKIASFD